MKIGIIPTYREIFGENPPELSSLIVGIPSKLIVSLVSVMNGELYLSQNDLRTQIKILNFLLQRQTNQTRSEIYKKISEQFSRKGVDDFSIFSTHINIQFLHFSLEHYYEDQNFIDITPEQELKIFKAYFITSSKIFDEMRIDTDTESPVDYFRKNFWPMMIGQFLLNHPYNYFLAIVKSKCFFDSLEFEAGLGEYVRAFVGRFNDPNSLTYILRFANTLQEAQLRNDAKKIAPFSIRADGTSIPFFDELSINLKKYSSNFITNKSNYKGLKEKPLFKVRPDSYVIINWDFLSRKIYDGMIFDFHNISGIKQEKRFKSFPLFKQFVGQEAIEKYLFRRLVNGCFKNKYAIIKFDEGEFAGFPDAYVRVGNKVFLFEIKDSLFSAKAIDSENYELVKEEIDKKYNTEKPKRKGTYQLVNQIEKLLIKPFEAESYDQLNLKTRNLMIYPIIIYTDSHFGLPGIGNYLQEEFLKSNFKNVKDLSFIDIDFLVAKISQLQKKDLTLDKLIDLTIQEMKKRHKRLHRINNIDNLMLLNDNFQSLCSKHLKKFNSDGNYVKVLFDELDLSRGLQPEKVHNKH